MPNLKIYSFGKGFCKEFSTNTPDSQETVQTIRGPC